MSGWTAKVSSILTRLSYGDRAPSLAPILVHAHEKEAVPSGPLENGMIEFERDGLILHAVAEIVRPDGTFCDLPADRIGWAARLSYGHLKREGLLEAYGLSVMPGHEPDSA
jgi:hypothetical protein